MKKIISIFSLGVVAIFAASCQKEENVNSFATDGDSITFRVESPAVKVSFNAGKTCWEAGDQIAVFDGTTKEIVTLSDTDINATGTGATISTSTLSASAAKYYAVYPASIAEEPSAFLNNGNVVLKANKAQSSDSTLPCVAMCTSPETTLSFENIGSIVSFSVPSSSTIKTVVFVANGGENLSGESHYVKYTLASGETSGNISVNSAVLSKGFTVIAKDADGNYLGSYKTASSKTFEKGYYYKLGELSSSKYNVPAGAIPWEYTIASGKTAYFAQGNLRYDVSSNKWSFYEKSYDCPTAASETLLTHFTWGYGTWSTTAKSTTALGGYASNGANWNLSSEDFGLAIGAGWRTPAGGGSGMWYSIITGRSASSKYAKATITDSGRNYTGLILFPDDYVAPAGMSISEINSVSSAYSSNTLTVEQWADLEYAGCVFLPAAGYRKDSGDFSLQTTGEKGFYASSTSMKSNKCVRLQFNTTAVNPNDTAGLRAHGYSVRLIYPLS